MESNPRDEGRMAHGVCLVLADCPYEFATEEGRQWMDGWWDGYYGIGESAAARKQGGEEEE